MIQEKTTFFNSNGEPLSAIVRIPEGAGKFPAVVLCHGFALNKDNELMFGLWDAISRAGFVCLRFDFTGHGDSKGNFRELTISQEIRDVKNAVEYLKTTNIVDEKRIAIVGHSLGASVAMLAAEEGRIKAVAEISGVARLEDFISSKFNDFQVKEWKKKGYIQLHNFDELSIDMLRDIKRHDLLSGLKKMKCPLLIIHGTDDTLVPFENAREIFNHANDPKFLELVDGADHFFRNAQDREMLYEVIVGFLQRSMAP